MAETEQKAVVLLSGGLDSTTTAAMARAQGFVWHGLTISYGQRHAIEARAAARVAASLGAERHVVQHLDLRAFGGSALTDNIDVPKSATVAEMPRGIPVTYVPARNTIFLSLALAYAETIEAHDIFIGVSAVDYSGYPDCRPDFIRAFEQVARLGTRFGVEGAAVNIRAPLIQMSKADTIREAVRLGADLSLTHSCYDPTEDGLACGFCDSCLLRKKGFEEAGVADPTRYAATA